MLFPHLVILVYLRQSRHQNNGIVQIVQHFYQSRCHVP